MNSILLNSLINRDIEKELISVLRIKIESRRNGRTDSWKIVNELLKKKGKSREIRSSVEKIGNRIIIKSVGREKLERKVKRKKKNGSRMGKKTGKLERGLSVCLWSFVADFPECSARVKRT